MKDKKSNEVEENLKERRLWKTFTKEDYERHLWKKVMKEAYERHWWQIVMKDSYKRW